LTPVADDAKSPGSTPRLTMPVAAVQRKARQKFELSQLEPTTTEPSALTAVACVLVEPGRVPRLTMPVAAVQRKA
jgi:hypothetical protein